MQKREVHFSGDALKIMLTLKTTTEKQEQKGNMNPKSKKLLYMILKLVERIENNIRLDSEVFKKMAGLKKSWELRITFDKESHRFYGTYKNKQLIIMRYYLSKKTTKTPRNILNKLKRDEKLL